MRLPIYITGLTNNNVDLIQMDGLLFQKVGYEIARKLRGEVIGYNPPNYPLKYFRLDIRRADKIISILLHAYFPYVAIASYKSELQIQFLDDENLTIELSPYYTVLKTSFLNEPFNPDLHDLSKVELNNEKHWRPNTNGEVIFNCWD